MLTSEGNTLSDFESVPMDCPWTTEEPQPTTEQMTAHIGSGSGGYADHIFHYAAKELFGEDNVTLQYRNLR